MNETIIKLIEDRKSYLDKELKKELERYNYYVNELSFSKSEIESIEKELKELES